MSGNGHLVYDCRQLVPTCSTRTGRAEQLVQTGWTPGDCRSARTQGQPALAARAALHPCARDTTDGLREKSRARRRSLGATGQRACSCPRRHTAGRFSVDCHERHTALARHRSGASARCGPDRRKVPSRSKPPVLNKLHAAACHNLFRISNKAFQLVQAVRRTCPPPFAIGLLPCAGTCLKLSFTSRPPAAHRQTATARTARMQSRNRMKNRSCSA